MADGPVPKAEFRLTGPWTKMSKLLTDKTATGGRIRLLMNRATVINASIARKSIRKAVQGTVAPPNATLTTLLKKSSKPLVDTGQLFKAITFVSIDAFTAEIGVKKGDKAANMAVLLHEGAMIKVTPKMRAMFEVLSAVSRGEFKPSYLTGRAKQLWAKKPGGWKALKPGTTHIKIPARRFIKIGMENLAMREKMAHNWTQAFAAALAGLDKFDAKR